MRNSRLILVHETKAIPLVVMVAIPSAFALYTVGLFATSKHLSSWVITKDSYSQFGFPQHTASASGPRPPSPRVSLDGTKANTQGPRPLLFRALATLESNKLVVSINVCSREAWNYARAVNNFNFESGQSKTSCATTARAARP